MSNLVPYYPVYPEKYHSHEKICIRCTTEIEAKEVSLLMLKHNKGLQDLSDYFDGCDRIDLYPERERRKNAKPENGWDHTIFAEEEGYTIVPAAEVIAHLKGEYVSSTVDNYQIW